MRNAIAVGIGLFIAFIGFQGASVIVAVPGQLVKLNPQVATPDVLVFAFGLLLTAGLYARGVRGSIVLGILATTLLSGALQWLIPQLPAWISPVGVGEPVETDEPLQAGVGGRVGPAVQWPPR